MKGDFTKKQYDELNEIREAILDFKCDVLLHFKGREERCIPFTQAESCFSTLISEVFIKLSVLARMMLDNLDE